MTSAPITIAELSPAREVVAALLRPLVADEKVYEALFASASALEHPEWSHEALTWLAYARRPA